MIIVIISSVLGMIGAAFMGYVTGKDHGYEEGFNAGRKDRMELEELKQEKLNADFWRGLL
jgi:hypothetical protein